MAGTHSHVRRYAVYKAELRVVYKLRFLPLFHRFYSQAHLFVFLVYRLVEYVGNISIQAQYSLHQAQHVFIGLVFVFGVSLGNEFLVYMPAVRFYQLFTVFVHLFKTRRFPYTVHSVYARLDRHPWQEL